MITLSKNFSLEEMTASSTAKLKKIDNTPSPEILANLKKLCVEVLQPIRDKYGFPILVSSGYRSPELNKAVGGVSSSQHLKGEACDISNKDKTKNLELFNLIVKMIKENEIVIGQLIWETGGEKTKYKNYPKWLHISLPYKKVNEIIYI